MITTTGLPSVTGSGFYPSVAYAQAHGRAPSYPQALSDRTINLPSPSSRGPAKCSLGTFESFFEDASRVVTYDVEGNVYYLLIF